MGNANNLISTSTINKKINSNKQLSFFKINPYYNNQIFPNNNLANLSHNNSLINNNKNKKNFIYSSDLNHFSNSFSHSSIKIKGSLSMAMSKDGFSINSTVNKPLTDNKTINLLKKKSHSSKKNIHANKIAKHFFQHTFKTITSYFNQSINKTNKSTHKIHYIKKYQTNKKTKKKLDINKIYIPNENDNNVNNEENKLHSETLQIANINQSSQLTLINNMNKNYFTSLQEVNDKYQNNNDQKINHSSLNNDVSNISENLNINEDIDIYNSEILIKKNIELLKNLSNRTSYIYNKPQNFTEINTKDDKLNLENLEFDKYDIKFYGKEIENKKNGTSKIIFNDDIIFYGNYNDNNLDGPFLIENMREGNRLEGFINKDYNFIQYIVLTKIDLQAKKKKIKDAIHIKKDENESYLEENNDKNKIKENDLDNKTEDSKFKIDPKDLNNLNNIIFENVFYNVNEKNSDVITNKYSDIVSVITNYSKLSKILSSKKNEYTNKIHNSILRIESETDKNNFNGISIVSYKDNSFYLGEIKNNFLHGIGRFQWPDGTQYLGEFNKGKLTGYGIIYYFDMRIYYGETLDGVPHGFGEFLWPDHKKYIGYYKRGEKNGFGIYVIRNNNEKLIYFGFWKNGKQDGYGVILKNKKLIYTIYKEGKLIKEHNKDFFIKKILSKKGCGKFSKMFLYDVNELKKLAKFRLED